MSRLYISIISIFALLLAACAPPPQEFDWCYTYDFTESDYDINIAAGAWVSGEGIVSVANEIVVNWETEYFVDANRVSVLLRRGDGVTGVINIAAIAQAFGVEISNSGDLPSEISEIQPYGYDDNPTESTRTVNATVATSAEVVIESMTISGYGVSPFPTNPCGPATETPPPAPTNTPAPTSSPTNTPTPTGTQELCWEVIFDFTQGQEGWTADFGSYSSGIGFVNATSYGGIFKSNGIGIGTAGYSGTNVSNIRINYIYSPGEGASTFRINGGLQSISAATASDHIEWNGTQSFAASMAFDGTIGYKVGSVPSPEGSIVVTSARFRGYGGSPTSSWISNGGSVSYIPCYLQTPTPTTTPEISNTPTTTPTRTLLPVTPIGSATVTRTPIVVSSPTISPTPTPTNSPAPTLPPAPTNTPAPTFTASATRTLIPLPTAGPGTPTPEGTYGLPNFGTLPGSPVFATLVGTPPPEFTPLLTQIPLPGGYKSEVYNYVATAASAINQLPDDIAGQIPEISPGISLFGQYAKGISSGVSLQEMLGRKLYEIGVHVFYAIAVVFSMSLIYAIVYIAKEAIKFVLWITGWLAKIIGMFRG